MFKYVDDLTDRQGNAIVGASIAVVAYPGNTAVTIYSDDGVTAIANATVTTDVNGTFQFYAPAGRYNFTETLAGVTLGTRTDVQIFSDSTISIWSGTAGGTANALTLTPSPSIASYQTGQTFKFKSSATANTAATTIAISGLATKAVQRNGVALIGGEIAASQWYEVLYDGAAFQLSAVGSDIFQPSGAGAVARPVQTELNGKRIDNIADLRNFAGVSTGDVVHVTSYYSGWAALAEGPTGGGFFVWDGASTATHNGGTIISLNAGGTGRWKRISARISLRDFGAKGDFSDEATTYINSAFSWAQTEGREIYDDGGTYKCGNILYGAQNIASQSPAPIGFIGSGLNTIFKAKSGASGTLFQAWTISGVRLEGFRINCNNEAGISIGLDTEWKIGAGGSLHNTYRDLLVENYSGMGWNRINNNECLTENITIRNPTTPDSASTTQTAIDAQASGGNVSFINCYWPDAIMELCAQNAVFNACWGMGIRYDKTQTGNNITHFAGGQLYANKKTLACISDFNVSASGHYTFGISANGLTFLPTVNGHAIFDIGLNGAINLTECATDSSVNWSMFGSNAVNKAGAGLSRLVLDNFASLGSGTATFNTISGITNDNRYKDIGGVKTSHYTIDTYIPVWTTSGTAPVLGNGTLTGDLYRNGRDVTAHIILTPGSTTTFGTGVWRFSLPANAFISGPAAGSARLTQTGVNEYLGMPICATAYVEIFTTASPIANVNATTPFTWANGHVLYLTLTYITVAP